MTLEWDEYPDGSLWATHGFYEYALELSQPPKLRIYQIKLESTSSTFDLEVLKRLAQLHAEKHPA